MGENLRQQPLQRPAQPRLTSKGEHERHSEQAADQHNGGLRDLEWVTGR